MTSAGLNSETIKNFRSKENFPVASLLVPSYARRSILALYRFARSADEIADDHDMPDEVRRGKLKKMHDELLSGNVKNSDQAVKNYYNICVYEGMNIKHGLALLEAFIQDTQKKHYHSWQETLTYCRMSASSIGLSVLEASAEFSADHEAADKICAVLQLINHLQDVKKDYLNDNRIYFDSSLIDPEDITKDIETIKFTEGKKEIIRRLREMLSSASVIFKTIKSFRIRAEVATIYNIADMLLTELEHRDVLMQGRVELTKKQKRSAFIKGFVLAFKVKNILKYSARNMAVFSGSSFLKPMLRLDFRRRKAILCFYAFCRLLDDAADKYNDKNDAVFRLEQWQDEIGKIYSPETLELPSHPVTREFALYVKRYSIEKQHLLEMVGGQYMDISGEMVRPSNEVFDIYCYRVASCVGLVSVQIFDYHTINTAKIQRFAIHLGKALQIINIMRDVKEDAARGRIYLPGSILSSHGFNYSAAAIVSGYDKIKVELAPVLKDMSALASEHFMQAEENLPLEDVRNMRSALMMKKVYMAYLDKMKAKDFIFTRKDIKLSPVEKSKLYIGT